MNAKGLARHGNTLGRSGDLIRVLQEPSRRLNMISREEVTAQVFKTAINGVSILHGYGSVLSHLG